MLYYGLSFHQDYNAMTRRKLLVTSALPYANGSIHLGHMVELVQTDIWVRFQKMQGHECWYICGDDAHGTPIMIAAEKQGITPEELVKRIQQEHSRDCQDFLIAFDNFYTTHSPENEELAGLIYNRLKEKGDITATVIEQAFDPVKQMFLPDRFVKGKCPCCKTPDQYGDSCENCGATYTPAKLIDPISILSGETPITKESEHLFFELGHYTDYLKQWLQNGHLQTQIANKLAEWFKEGLQPWDISREAPYFGFKIPGTTNKYFYVWLDAPVGYMASFKNFCEKNPQVNFEEFWKPDSSTELYHFVGKDITYFHGLFWPAMLHGANFRTPTAIYAHGFLTVDGQKMSKSRGTFIKARTYLNHLNPEYLRYYFAAKLMDTVDDIDLNLEDFTARVNADLVGKVVNIASRCAAFIEKYLDNSLGQPCPNTELYQKAVNAGEKIANHYQAREYAMAVREIMELADAANQYIDAQKPWQLIKTPGNEFVVQGVCTLGINLFRILMTYLKPILPQTARAVEEFLQIPNLDWNSRGNYLTDHLIKSYEPLLTRIDAEKIKAMKEETLVETNAAQAVTTPATNQEPAAATIDYDAFANVDLRIAKIVEAEEVKEADKLLRLVVDLGNDQKRQIFAGIKSAYQPEDLIGRLTVIVANLAPRKMRFGLSEGMVICAGSEKGGKELWLLSPDDGAQPGMRVK